MNKWARAITALVLGAGCFLAGRWYDQRIMSGSGSQSTRRILYYQDPMHPAYRSEKPGIAPDCGMQLEPVYAESRTDYAAGSARTESSSGALHVTSQQRRIIGLRTEAVTRATKSPTLRVLGRVALDETRIYRVAAAVDGWVRKAGPIVTGNMVQKDEVLATFYNRDFLTAQQTYLYALNTMDRFKNNESEDQLKLTRAQMRASEENLEFLGMGETQLREVARTREVAKDIEFRSPVAGLVVARNAFSGLRFDRGTELFRIADINRIWILADVFESDAPLLRAARSATVHYQDQQYPVRISNTVPQFDAASRVLKVRLEADNPGLSLRPDMFVDVEFQLALPQGIAVPVDAVIDSGLRRIVYVESSEGYFTPRLVETGWRMGDSVQITKGLEPGERIVVTGNFLLDSETRMRLTAPVAAAAAAKDPVCGMEIDPANAAGTSVYRGNTYYFCSKSCKERFDKAADNYAGTLLSAHQASLSHD